MAFYTIIVPTFNSEHTLKKCLDSVMNQTFGDFELIISDGVSTDGTIEILKEYGDNRISFFSEKDKGVYDAMNKAVNLAVGKWLYFLGSDDELYSPTVLEEVKVNLDKTDADLVYGNVKIVGDCSWAHDGQIYMGEISLRTLLEHNICHQSIFYSEKIFKQNKRYNIEYKVCSDYDFNLYCAAKYKMQFIPVVIASFLAGGLSSVATDSAFGEDRWMNTIKYFGAKLFDRELSIYRNPIRNTWKRFFKRSEFKLSALAFALSLYYKFRKY